MSAVTTHTRERSMAPAPVPPRGLDRLRLFRAPAEDPSVGAIRGLEAAGFVVHLAGASPLRIVGGTAFEGSRPVVYSDGFCVLAEDGRYVVSSTSAKGRSVDETSYESLADAVDALVKAYGSSLSSDPR